MVRTSTATADQATARQPVQSAAAAVGGLALARTVSAARLYLVGGGALYLVLWLYGLAVDHASAANFLPVNHQDNWLHLGLGLGMLALGLLFNRRQVIGR